MTTRVVQWATGSIGRVVLRAVLDDPELELVGLKVHNAAKASKDAGEIIRRPPTGVIATDSIEDILALDADVVLHVPLNGESPDEHVEDIERLLRSGKNVITTVGFTYPWAVDRARAARLDEAARAGGVTLFGTGMNPGFLSERIAVLVTGMCTEVQSITTQEVYDCTPVASTGFIFDLCGFGRPEADFWRASKGRGEFFDSLFGEVLGYVIDALRLPVDEVTRDHSALVADADVQTAAGVVPAGTVRGVTWQWHARNAGADVLTLRMIWFTGPPEPGWADGWQIRVEGSPRVKLDLEWLDPIGRPEKSKAVQYATAGPVVRAIDDVVAAKPGILVPPPTFTAYRGPAATSLGGAVATDVSALLTARS